jgi:hypothetical protein
MKKHWFCSYFGLTLLILATGCASPRIISYDQTSVIVAVPEDTDEFPHYYKTEATKLAKSKIPDAEFVESSRVKDGKVIQAGATQPVKPSETQKKDGASTDSEKVEYYLEYRSKATLSPLSTKPLAPPARPNGTGTETPKPNEPTTLPPIPLGTTKKPEPRTVPPITNPSPIQNNFPNTAMPR